MTNQRKTERDSNALYLRALEAREQYASDETNVVPISLFLIAFKRFWTIAQIERRARFKDATRYFDEFAKRCAELEEDDDAEGVWRLFENGVALVDHYDRARRARTTPPSETIDELIAQGVSRRQIAIIYGFYLQNGEPDVDAVERRDPWKAPDPEPEEEPPIEDAAELARLAVDALARIGDGEGEPVDAATLAELSELLPEPVEPEPEAAPTPEETDAKIEREILDGVPARQIAARYGVDVEAIKERADALNVKASEIAEELPPRLVQAIEAKREELTEGKTYRQIARAVSSAERRVTEAEVKRVLGAR
ncbi:MAG: hypothetical protein IJM30_03740 [Thermoguttaceae bacterium]|nr:hypothetical protein [Thermoguttaceae bacterium]